MAYNKAREEKKWRLWKAAEEKRLRELGVSEDVIEKLRAADWEDFKAERRFYERYADPDTYLDWQAAEEPATSILTVEKLLDEIDNEQLHRLLLTVDKLTLLIILLMLEGYSQREIALRLTLTEKAVYRRMDRLKEKIKKHLF